jgi:hypothetical protein
MDWKKLATNNFFLCPVEQWTQNHVLGPSYYPVLYSPNYHDSCHYLPLPSGFLECIAIDRGRKLNK